MISIKMNKLILNVSVSVVLIFVSFACHALASDDGGGDDCINCDPLKVVQVEIGHHHSCALFDNGRVKCWGSNSRGELGYGHKRVLGDDTGEMGNNLPFVDLGTFSDKFVIRNLKATQISVGVEHSCALLENQKVKCWGSNWHAQLGLGHTDHIGDNSGEMGDNLPYVNLGTGARVTQIKASYRHTCAIFDNNDTKCWGSNYENQLGRYNYDGGIIYTLYGDNSSEMGNSIPVLDYNRNRYATQIVPAGDNSCALLDNGKIKCWGTNYYYDPSLNILKLGFGYQAVDLSGTFFHYCTAFDDGGVKCWGHNNSYGQLGTGDTDTIDVTGATFGYDPAEFDAIELDSFSDAIQVQTGDFHNCALLQNSTTSRTQIKCWGQNTYGQLGIGGRGHRGDDAGELGTNLPSVNFGFNNYGQPYEPVSVASGGYHNCALFSNGRIKCWGNGRYGRTGYEHENDIGLSSSDMGNQLPFVDLGTE